MRVGVVVVHGVMPQIRHGFQDDVATALCGALNPKNAKEWTMTVVLPKNGTANANDVPTISRVHRSREDADDPTGDFFDVHEAYWSPIDKGKTSFRSVLTWLVTTIFLPFNDFARYREHPAKIAWDLAMILLATLVGIGLLLFAGIMAAEGIRNVTCMMGAGDAVHVQCNPAFDFVVTIRHLPRTMFEGDAWRRAFDVLASTFAFVLSPMTFVKTLHANIVVGLVSCALGGYLAFQGARAALFILFNIPEFLRRDIVQLASRVVWTVGLAGVAATLIYLGLDTSVGQSPHAARIGANGALLIAALVAFNLGRNYLAWFVMSFFGDVQIYTTRDQNADFFALREQILETVVKSMLNVVTGAPSGAPYDRVYILAHSLGSTISMDAILRLYDMQAASSTLKDPPLSVADWNRIRGFVTFGTALEKTKYFFSVWNPTPSQEWEQWNAAVYGTVFTGEWNTLTGSDASRGIYWHNNWFFSDFVSDEICTYRSFLLPGDRVSDNASVMSRIQTALKKRKKGPVIGRLVAANRSIFGPFPRYLETHTHYVDSRWFWHAKSSGDIGVLDVLTSGLNHPTPATHRSPETHMALSQIAAAAPSKPSRIEPIPEWTSKLHKSWEVIR